MSFSELMFLKNKQDFKEKLNIELLINYAEYRGNKNRYPYKCLKCGYVGEKKYGDLKSGRGCPVCAGNLITEEIFNKDKQKFKDELNIELLINYDEYKGNKIKYPYKCLKCGHKDEKSFNSLKNGQGCPVCATRITTEEIFNKDKEKFRSELNIELLIDYKDYKNNYMRHPYRCLKCGYKDEKSFRNLRTGLKCPVCAGLKITEEIFNKDKQNMRSNLNIELLIDFDEYKGNKIKYPYKCLKCGYEGNKKYSELKSGAGCIVCAHRIITEEIFNKDKEGFKKSLNIELLIDFDEYKGNKIKYPYKCLKCGYKGNKKYDSLKNGVGCLNCALILSISKAEQEIKEYIETIYDNQIITSDRKILKPYELDIYLPDINLAFEFNGSYWHSDKHKSKKYHHNKWNKCNKKNIRLYQIYEDDWNNNKEQVKQHIRELIQNKELYDFSYDTVELDLDGGYDINKYLNNNYIIKEIRENIMIKDDKHKIYGSGLIIMKRIECEKNV